VASAVLKEVQGSVIMTIILITIASIIPAVWWNTTLSWSFHDHDVATSELFLRMVWISLMPLAFLIGVLNFRTRKASVLILIGYSLLFFLFGMSYSSTEAQITSFLQGRPNPLCPPPVHR
jgi:hypothetical protein